MQTLQELREEHFSYIDKIGGYMELREADEYNNDLNREQIKVFAAEKGKAWLCDVNYYDEQRERVVSGTESVYTEYTGQLISNFQYAICVPAPDAELANMIRRWNIKGTAMQPGSLQLLEAISDKVAALGGIELIWS